MPYQIDMPDLGKIFLQAQQYNNMRLEAEQRRQQMEQNRRKEVLFNQIQDAQQKYFHAEPGPQQDAAMADIKSLDFERAASINADRNASEQQAIRNHELKMDQNLKGAEYMQQLLPQTMTQTNVGPQINLSGIFQAQQAMKKMADDGAIDPDQARVIDDIFRQGQELVRNGADITSPEMRELTRKIQNTYEGAGQAIQLLGNPEKRKELNTKLFDQAREGSNIIAENGGDGDTVNRATDPTWLKLNRPEIWAAAGMRLRERNMAMAKARGVNVSTVVQAPGTNKPTGQTETDLQQKNLMWADIEQGSQGIIDNFNPETLSYFGKIKGWTLKRINNLDPKDKLGLVGEEGKKFIDQMAELHTRSTLNSYNFILAMSGKAVTDAERAMILKAVGDPDNMSPEEFLAVNKIVNRLAKEKREGTARTLTYGIDVFTSDKERDDVTKQQSNIAELLDKGVIDEAGARERLKNLYNSWDTKVKLKAYEANKKVDETLADKKKRLEELRNQGAQ